MYRPIGVGGVIATLALLQYGEKPITKKELVTGLVGKYSTSEETALRAIALAELCGTLKETDGFLKIIGRS